MAWQEASIVEQRVEFVVLASVPGANVAALCRRFGISRQTGYKWLTRFRSGGQAAMVDRSRRPRASPHQTGAGVRDAVLRLRDTHPAWGGRKLRARLHALGVTEAPAASTITAILRRHGRLDAAESHKHTAWTRFEHERPNQLWQMDFKGHVPMHVGGRCHPLTVLDDHSRFSIGLWACVNEQRETVRTHLTAMFRRYGMPERILTDNGPPWGTMELRGHTRLTLWLLRLGIPVSHGRPRHPQTQGKEERFHRTLNAELLSRQELRDVTHAQQAFDRWRDIYNLERPNEAIGLATPASRYRISERVYPEKLPELEFSPDDEVRRVKKNATLCYRGWRWHVGVAFVGEPLGVRTTPAGQVEVRYGPHVVARLDPSEATDRNGRRRPPAPLGPAARALAPPAAGGMINECQ